MAVPTYDRFIEPMLRYLANHPEGAPARDVHDAAAAAFGLSEADRAELLPSGLQAVYKNRVGWAHDRLKRAGLSVSLRRGHWKLTEQGQAFARDHQPPLTAETIKRLVTEYWNVRLRPASENALTQSQAVSSLLPQRLLRRQSNLPVRSNASSSSTVRSWST